MIRLLSLAWVIGLMSCTGVDPSAGTTSETENTVAGIFNPGASSAKMAFTKHTESGFATDSVIETQVDSKGAFELKLESEQYYFLEYSYEDKSLWIDSVYSGPKGLEGKLELELSDRVDLPRFLWSLEGRIPQELTLNSDSLMIGFEGTPFFYPVNEEGNFQLDKVLDSHTLVLRYLNEGEWQTLSVEGWSSQWTGPKDLWDMQIQDSLLKVNICPEIQSKLLLQSTDSDLNSEWEYNLCEHTIQERTIELASSQLTQSGGSLVNLQDGSIYQFDNDGWVPSNLPSTQFLNTYSLAQNEFIAAELTFLPSSNQINLARSLDSLANTQWIQSLVLDPDSTQQLELWGEELWTWNSQGDVKVYSILNLNDTPKEFNLGVIVDMAKISEDYLLVLKPENILASYQISTKTYVTEKVINDKGQIYQMGLVVQ